MTLHESGAEFDVKPISLKNKQQHDVEYLRINPKAKVPVLVVDGEVLTENVAILTWLVNAFCAKKLLPTDPKNAIKALSLMAWCASGLHPPLTRIFDPARYCSVPGSEESIRKLALKEVIQIARRCSGGIVLGFTQMMVQAGIQKPGVLDKPVIDMPYPTPWNHLEAGILFSLRLPVLVFREEGISGGIFDEGVTDVFIHRMPTVADFEKKAGSVRQVLMKWQARVRSHYYEWEG